VCIYIRENDGCTKSSDTCDPEDAAAEVFMEKLKSGTF
jgi:hypothetical protein